MAGGRPGAISGQQPVGEVEHLAGHPVAAGERVDDGVGAAEAGERARPVGDRPRAGGLGQVAEHGERAAPPAGGRPRGTASARGPAPRRARRARSPACARAGRPPRRPGRRRPRSRARCAPTAAPPASAAAACSASSRTPRAARASRAASVSSAATRPARVPGRPDRVQEGAHLGAAGGAAGLGVGRAAAGLLLLPAGVLGQPHRQPLPAGGVVQQQLVVVAPGPAAEVVDVALEPLDGHPVAAAGQRHLERVGRLGDAAPQRPAQHLGHPGVALEHGDLRRVDRAHRHPRGQVGDGASARRRPRRGSAAPARCSAGRPGSGPTTRTPERASWPGCV